MNIRLKALFSSKVLEACWVSRLILSFDRRKQSNPFPPSASVVIPNIQSYPVVRHQWTLFVLVKNYQSPTITDSPHDMWITYIAAFMLMIHMAVTKRVVMSWHKFQRLNALTLQGSRRWLEVDDPSICHPRLYVWPLGEWNLWYRYRCRPRRRYAWCCCVQRRELKTIVRI